MADNELQDILNAPTSSASFNLTPIVPENITPEEAAENISKAPQYELSPDGYADLKQDIKRDEPVDVPTRVGNVARRSQQHARIIASEEPGFWQRLENYKDFTMEAIKGKGLHRELNDLTRELVAGQLSLARLEKYEGMLKNPHEGMNVHYVNAQIQAAQKELEGKDIDFLAFRQAALEAQVEAMDPEQKFGLNWKEQIGGDVVAGSLDIIMGLWNQKGIVAGGAATGAGLGAVAGIPGGPISAAAVGTLGAVKGGALGLTAAFATDSFKQSYGMVYRELNKGFQDTSLEAVETRHTIATGAAMLVAAVDTFPVGYLLNRIPVIKKLKEGGVKYAVQELTRNQKFRKAVMEMGKQGLFEGVTEVIQDFIEDAAGASVSKDGVVSFKEGAKTAIDETTFQGVLRTFLTSVGIGSVMHVGGRTVGKGVGKGVEIAESKALKALGAEKVTPTPQAPPPKPQPQPSDIVSVDPDSTIVEKTGSAARVTQGLIALADLKKKSKTNQLLPGEIESVSQQMFEDSGVSTLYISKESIAKHYGKDKKSPSEIVEEIKNSEDDGSNLMEVSVAEALTIVEKDQELAKHFKASPLSPSLAEIETNAREGGQHMDSDILGERPYVEADTFENPDNNTELREAKEGLAKDIKKGEKHDITQVIDLEQRREEATRNQELLEFAKDGNKSVDIVDKFMSDQPFVGDLSPEQNALVKKKKRAYSINPSTLNPTQYIKYVKDGTMKKRKVFDKNGLHAEEAASIMGFEDVDAMLDTLANTPTREEATKNYQDYLQKQQEAETRTESILRESEFAKAYDKVLDAHAKEAEQINSEANLGFEKPNLTEITNEAHETISNTPLKFLNPTKFKVDERVNQRKANEAIKAGNYAEAHRQKINAIRNTALAKEAHIALSKVNRASAFFTNVETGTLGNIMRDAPADIKNAFNHIKDVFGIDPDVMGTTDPSALQKLQNKLNKEGNTTSVIIPDEVYTWSETQPNYKDLTPDQIEYAENHLREVVTLATKEHLLYSQALEGYDTDSVDIIANAVADQLKSQVNYNQNRTAYKPPSITAKDKFVDWFKDAGLALHKNYNYLILQSEAGKRGLLREALYNNLDAGLGKKADYLVRFANFTKRGEKIYGNKTKFDEAMNKPVYVSEFANIKALYHGKMQRGDLVMLLANLGNAENAKRIENFGISKEQTLDVTKKYLSEKDFQYVQEGIWDLFADIQKEYLDLSFRTTGKILTPTKATPINAFGKTWTGGHLPLQYQYNQAINKSLEAQVATLADSIDPTKRVKSLPQDAWEGIVKTQHDKERSSTDWKVDLDPGSLVRSLENLAHDMALREPVQDAMKLITHPSMQEGIIGTIGSDNYNSLVNNIMSMTKTRADYDYFRRENNNLGKAIRYLNDVAIVQWIGYNIGSVALNAASGVQGRFVMMSEGRNGSLHMLNAIVSMAPDLGKDATELARMVDPSMNTYSEIMEAAFGTTQDLAIPKRRSKSKTFRKLGRGKDRFIHFGMSTIQGVSERAMKLVVIKGAYNQFMAGDVNGWNYEKVISLTPEQREQAAQKYAKSIAQRSTYLNRDFDKAGFQKAGGANDLINRIFNDARNTINNMEMFARKSVWNVKEGIQKSKQGDYTGAYWSMTDAGTQLMVLMLMQQTLDIMFNVVKNQAPFATDEDKDEKGRGPTLLGTNLYDHLEMVPRWMIARVNLFDGDGGFSKDFLPVNAARFYSNNHPYLRMMSWTWDTDQTMTTPAFQMLTDAAIGFKNLVSGDLQELMDESSQMAYIHNMGRQNFKRMVSVPSILMGGLPVNALNQLREFTAEMNTGRLLPMDILQTPKAFVKHVEQIEELNEDEAFEAFRAKMNGEKSKNDRESQEYRDYMQELSNLKNQVKTNLDVTIDTPQAPLEWIETIKYAESGGRWNIQNQRGSAYGYFQFVKKTFDDLVKSPEGVAAGLKPSDRYTQQGQEKAMRIFTQQNIRGLVRAGVPVTLRSVYAAHHFGVGRAVEAFKQSDGQRLPEGFFSKIVREQNPALDSGSLTDGKRVTTTGDLKVYLGTILKRGEREMQKSQGNQLARLR